MPKRLIPPGLAPLRHMCDWMHGHIRRAPTHGTVRHGTARHGTARHGPARHGTRRPEQVPCLSHSCSASLPFGGESGAANSPAHPPVCVSPSEGAGKELSDDNGAQTTAHMGSGENMTL